MHPRHAKLARTILFVCAASLLTGCSALNAQKPTVSLKNASVRDVTAEGLTADFLVDVANPNAFALPVTAAEYKLGLGGVRVIDGKAEPSGSIPANGSLPVTVPIRLSFDKLLAAEQALARSGGNVPYDLDGALVFAAGGGGLPIPQNLRVPLNFSGTLNLRDALTNPHILTSPAARRVAESILGRGGILGDLLNR